MGNTDFAVYEDGLHHIPLKLIDPNPFNTRNQADYKDDQHRELADSIAAVGVQQPAVARPHNGRIQLIIGERRLRASKLAGKDTIPVIIKNNIDDRLAVELCIIENLQRKDIHALDEANGYKALIEIGDPKTAQYDVAAIAKKVGKSGSYVYQRLKLAELIPEAQKEFRSGFITAGHAVDIARLANADQERALEFCTKGYGGRRLDAPPTFRDLRAWIQDNILLDLDKAPFDTTDPKLVEGVPACNDCPKRSGSNPMLFPDMGKNTCTDPACFQTKKAALVNIKIDVIEEKAGVKPILVSHRHDKTDLEPGDVAKGRKGLVYSKDFKTHVYNNGSLEAIQKDSCKHTKLAVFVDNAEMRNNDKKKAGDSAFVCTDPFCTVHKDVRSSHASGAAAMSAQDRRAMRISKEYKLNLFGAIAEKMVKPTRADRELVALEFFGKLGHYVETPMISALGWDPKLGEWNAKSKLKALFSGMNEEKLNSTIVMFAIATDLSSMGQGKPTMLETVARRHHVVPEKILAAARQKFAKKPVEKKAAVKPTSKAKPAKARKVIDLAKKVSRKKGGKKRSK